jgi:AraC family transcriptional regulator, arabinose operon regulatory protein
VRRDKRIDTALELLAQNDEPINVSQLAAAVGLSPSRFSHLFVQRTGILPGKHLRLLKRFRLEQRLAQDILGELAGPWLNAKTPAHLDYTVADG